MSSEPTDILSQHEVGTVVLTCIDFRFREFVVPLIRNTFGIDSWDEIKLAGGAKNISMPGKEGRRETTLDDIGLAVSAHHASTIILLTHQNCGKYAVEGHTFDDPAAERAFHEKELDNAGEIVKKAFPSAKVKLGYVHIDQNGAVKIDAR